MKYSLYLILLVLVGITSCNREEKNNAPESKFVTYRPTAEDVVVGEAFFEPFEPFEVSGFARIYKNSFHHVLRFEGFSIDNGPNLKVYLSNSDENIDNNINLGPLLAASGSFNYTFSVNTDISVYKYIIVYSDKDKKLYCIAKL
jgi:hypothetical protein